MRCQAGFRYSDDEIVWCGRWRWHLGRHRAQWEWPNAIPPQRYVLLWRRDDVDERVVR